MRTPTPTPAMPRVHEGLVDAQVPKRQNRMPVHQGTRRRLVGPQPLTDSHEPWLLGKEVSQHISVSTAVITFESPSHFFSHAA